MNNVVSLVDRSETWTLSFSKDDFRSYVSNRGRIKFMIGDRVCAMDTIESVDFMGRVSKVFEDEFNVLYSSEKL
jgi:hypothetical protein